MNAWVEFKCDPKRYPSSEDFAKLKDLGLGGTAFVIGGNGTTVQCFSIYTLSSSVLFGNTIIAMNYSASCSNGSSCIYAGAFGSGYAPKNNVETLTFSDKTSIQNFGNLSESRFALAGCSDGITGVFGGGGDDGSFGYGSRRTDFATISVKSNLTSFGNLTVGRSALGSCGNKVIGVFGGGSKNRCYDFENTIDYINMKTRDIALDFGDLNSTYYLLCGTSSSEIGLFSGGNSGLSLIHKINFSTIGNSSNFGNMTAARYSLSGCSNNTRGCFVGGSTHTTIIDYVNFQNQSNAIDFGRLSVGTSTHTSCSGD